MAIKRGKSQSARRIALRIQIDQQCSLLGHPQSPSQIDRSGRLTDPSLLVGHTKDSRHARKRLYGLKTKLMANPGTIQNLGVCREYQFHVSRGFFLKIFP
jgi:hypothetical protein